MLCGGGQGGYIILGVMKWVGMEYDFKKWNGIVCKGKWNRYGSKGITCVEMESDQENGRNEERME